MRRCQVCGEQTEEPWAWQPFGPDELWTFAFPGWHYRGFPVVHACDACKDTIQAGEPIGFTYRGVAYRTTEAGVVPVT